MLERWTSRIAMPWQARAQWHVGADRLWLQVTRRGLRFARADDASFVEKPLAADEPLADATAALLRGVAPGLGRTRVDVTLDDATVRVFSVLPPAGSRGLADLRAAAALRFERLYGESLDRGWCLDAAWHARRSFVGVAMPLALRDALLEPLMAARWPIGSIAPNFVRQWQAQRDRLRRPGTWLVVRGAAEAVTVWVRAGDGDRVRQASAPPATWSEAAALKRWIEAEALQLDVDMPRTLLVCAWGDEDMAVERQSIDGLTLIGSASALSFGAARVASP